MNQPLEMPLELIAPPIEPETAVEFVWSPAEDYRRRLLGRLHPGEQFIAASRLSVDAMPQIAGPSQVEDVRAAFLSQYVNAIPQPGECRALDPERALDKSLLSVINDSSGFRALFGCDLVVITEYEVAVLRPATSTLWRRMLMTPQSIAQIHAAVDVDLSAGPTVALVSVPWRYMQLVGPRGLRRSLADAGTIAALLERTEQDARISIAWDFVDSMLNAALEYDGLERSVVAIGSVVRGPSHA